MFTQMKVIVLSDFEGRQVIDVKVSDMGERPPVRLSLIGDFKGCDTTPDEAFTLDRILKVLRGTINTFNKYKGSSMLPYYLRDLASQDYFPATILIDC